MHKNYLFRWDDSRNCIVIVLSWYKKKGRNIYNDHWKENIGQPETIIDGNKNVQKFSFTTSSLLLLF